MYFPVSPLVWPLHGTLQPFGPMPGRQLAVCHAAVLFAKPAAALASLSLQVVGPQNAPGSALWEVHVQPVSTINLRQPQATFV